MEHHIIINSFYISESESELVSEDDGEVSDSEESENYYDKILFFKKRSEYLPETESVSL